MLVGKRCSRCADSEAHGITYLRRLVTLGQTHRAAAEQGR
jgi:hypothetical protein